MAPLKLPRHALKARFCLLDSALSGAVLRTEQLSLLQHGSCLTTGCRTGLQLL
jgi:hypothetical protein